MDSAKRVGIVVAGEMPPPSKLRSPKMDDSDETEKPDEQDAEEKDFAPGMSAFSTMMKSWESGDKEAAYDAFMDAVRLCSAEDKGPGPEGMSEGKPYE